MRKISTILLVDDDETTNFLHERLLERFDISEQVLVARNGSQALEILTQLNARVRSINPVLVLLDLNMPVMNGFEFLEAFQALPPAQQRCAIIVVLTSSLNAQDLARTANLPVAGTLTKPLNQAKIDTLRLLHLEATVAIG
jgi:CheY-like chemotaxis protein